MTTTVSPVIAKQVAFWNQKVSSAESSRPQQAAIRTQQATRSNIIQPNPTVNYPTVRSNALEPFEEEAGVSRARNRSELLPRTPPHADTHLQTTCFEGHHLSLVQHNERPRLNQRCTVCLASTQDTETQACSQCSFVVCSTCSPLDARNRPRAVFPRDRTIEISSIHMGNADDFVERLIVIIGSILSDDRAIEQFCIRLDLNRAWIVLASPRLLNTFLLKQEGPLNLFDGAIAYWRIYIPPVTRYVYRAALPDGLRGRMDAQLLIRRAIAITFNSIQSNDIETVVIDRRQGVCHIVFAKGEFDLKDAEDDLRILLIPLSSTNTTDNMEDGGYVEMEMVRTLATIFNSTTEQSLTPTPASTLPTTRNSSDSVSNAPNTLSYRSSTASASTTYRNSTASASSATIVNHRSTSITKPHVFPTRDNSAVGGDSASSSSSHPIPDNRTAKPLIVEPQKTCIVCYTGKALTDFPKSISLKKGHQSRKQVSHDQMCLGCMAGSLQVKVTDATGLAAPEQITCPCGCEGVLTYAAIRDLLAETYPKACDTYIKRLEDKSAVEIRNFKWCSNEHCESGQGVSEGDIDAFGSFTCRSCGFRTCARHERPASLRRFTRNTLGTGLVSIRENMECCTAAHLDRNDGEKRSLEWIRHNTKKCPKCRADIEKNEGCRHMTCINCKHEFFWCCLRDYRDRAQASLHNARCD